LVVPASSTAAPPLPVTDPGVPPLLLPPSSPAFELGRLLEQAAVKANTRRTAHGRMSKRCLDVTEHSSHSVTAVGSRRASVSISESYHNTTS
jgi:hypothetical protein